MIIKIIFLVLFFYYFFRDDKWDSGLVVFFQSKHKIKKKAEQAACMFLKNYHNYFFIFGVFIIEISMFFCIRVRI